MYNVLRIFWYVLVRSASYDVEPQNAAHMLRLDMILSKLLTQTCELRVTAEDAANIRLYST